MHTTSDELQTMSDKGNWQVEVVSQQIRWKLPITWTIDLLVLSKDTQKETSMDRSSSMIWGKLMLSMQENMQRPLYLDSNYSLTE